jgi:hypothetical protein
MNNQWLSQDFIPACKPAGMHNRFNSQELNVHKLENLEERTMVYNKPEVTKMASSIEVIKSQGAKEAPSTLDNYPVFTQIATPTAYEADE